MSITNGKYYTENLLFGFRLAANIVQLKDEIV